MPDPQQDVDVPAREQIKEAYRAALKGGKRAARASSRAVLRHALPAAKHAGSAAVSATEVVLRVGAEGVASGVGWAAAALQRVDFTSAAAGLIAALFLSRFRRRASTAGPAPPPPVAPLSAPPPPPPGCDSGAPVCDALSAHALSYGGDAAQLLLRFDWLAALLQAGGVSSLLKAVGVAANVAPPAASAPLAALAAALRRAAPGLRGLDGPAAATALAAQLAARLPATPALAPLRAAAAAAAAAPAAPHLRPLGALEAPGSALEACLEACGGAVTALAALPRGRLAAGCRDGRICIFDLGLSLQLGSLEGHAAAITQLAALGDGARLVSAASDGALRVWAPQPGAPAPAPPALCLRALPCGRVAALVALPGAARAASGGEGCDVVLWNLEAGRPEARLRGHSDRVTALAAVIIDDAHLLVSAAADGELRVWRAPPPALGEAREGPCCVAALAASGSSARALLSLSPLPRGRVAAATVEAVRVWDLAAAVAAHAALPAAEQALALGVGRPPGRAAEAGALQHLAITMQPVCVIMSGKVNAVAALADGRLVVGGDAALRTYAAAADEEGGAAPVLRALRGRRAATLCLLPLADGRLAAGCADGCVRVWSAGAAAPAAGAGAPAATDRICCLQPTGGEGGGGAVSAAWDGSLRVWGGRGELLRWAEACHVGRIELLAATDGGEYLATVAGGALRLWRPAAGAPGGLAATPLAAAAEASRGVTALASLRGPERLVVSGCGDGRLFVWDASAGAVLRCWDAHPGSRVCTLLVLQPPVADEVEAEAGAGGAHATRLARALLSGGADGSVRVWDCGSGALLAGLVDGHTDAVVAAASLAGGATLVTAGEDRCVCVWVEGGGGWLLRAQLRGAGGSDPPRALVPLGGASVAVLGARDSLRLLDCAANPPRLADARAGGVAAAAPAAARCAADAATLSTMALAVGSSVTAGLGGGRATATYLDDSVRLLVRLQGAGAGGGSRLAAGTEGGAVHFLELTA